MSDEQFDAKEVGAEHLSVDCRQKVRDKLQSEVEAFLAGGGKIQQIEKNISGDPPQRPGNNYTSRPI
ncbi:MAG: hypothetical protein AseanaTS_04010 [Candidatus Pelagadaptatus aseana]|uniref:hypothetical protein n=1 Tax=Candidatus Pelagadaptatus aseana TaxID=3120508 RepID=UPI0039B2CAA9